MVSIIDSPPAGVTLSDKDIYAELARRRAGYGRGKRMEIEKDKAVIISGLMKGKTIGSPLAIYIENTEYEEWEEVFLSGGRERYVPRPGHADYAGYLKYGFDNLRPVIERASARSTAAVVAAGACFKNLLKEFGIEIKSAVVAAGSVRADGLRLSKEEFEQAEDNDLRFIDEGLYRSARTKVETAMRTGTTLGGKVVVAAFGVVPGIGSYVAPDRRADARIAACLMSIPSVKAVEIGEGIRQSGMLGKDAQDEFDIKEGRPERRSNLAGGVEGGVTNGETVYAGVYFKPVPTQKKPLKSFDLRKKMEADAFYERSDVFVGPAVGVIAEAWMAYVLAELYTEKFGADTIEDMKQAYFAYCRRIRWPFR